jgi:exosortase D (VPLPA-CTERM-specific)
MLNNIKIKTVDYIRMTIFIILLTGIYFSSYEWLIKKDWVRDDYSASMLIPFLFLYLVWGKKDEFISTPSKYTWWGLLTLIPGFCLFWLGELSGEYFSIYLSSWLIFTGILWLHLGWQKLKIIIFPVVLLLAMFPLPNFIHGKLSLKLKLISSQLGVEMMQLMGMTAYREGNVIDLGFTQLQVVDACSGLRYLIPLIIMGVLLAYFFQKSWWKRIVLVLSTIPIAVLINGLRIFSVGFLYQFWGAAVAEGFFHEFSGWLILMVSLVFLYGEVLVLRKLGAEGRGQRVKEDQSSKLKGERENKEDKKVKRSESEREGVESLKLKAQSKIWSPHFIVSVILLGITLVASYSIEFRERIPITESFSKFPMTIGDWEGTTQPLEQRIIDTLDLSDYVMLNYINSDKQYINFYVAYYESQQKGESIHSPDTCLPGGGYTFKDSGLMELPLSQKNGNPMKVKRALMHKDETKQLAYYWFPMRGRILTNAYQMKFYTFWDALTRQRTDGALVRLITPVYQNESVEDADRRLKAFAAEAVPVLQKYLPE